MLAGFVRAASTVQEQAQSVARFGPLWFRLDDRSQVRLGGDVAMGPENLGQAHPRIVAVGPTADDCSQHRLGARGVALLPAIESGAELSCVAALFEGPNSISGPLLAIFT